jgi:uncharacterized protein YegP (UPF0339 family)
MPAKFVVKQSKKGFSFDLLATNGKVIATSTIYPTRRNCMLGIESVRKNAPGATVIEESGPAKGAAKAAAGNGAPGRAAAKPRTAASAAGAQAANGTRRGRAAKAAPAASAAAAAAKRAGRASKRTSST